MADFSSKDYIEKSIEEFKKRLETEREYCEQLYEEQTIRILGAKYSYYESGYPIFSDTQYDGEERSWYIMGRALGYLKENETSPCIGFDEKHSKAKEAKEFANSLTPYKGHK